MAAFFVVISEIIVAASNPTASTIPILIISSGIPFGAVSLT
jgi:hypothetical protein